MTLMATPRVCVLRAPGTNCDVETAHAFSSCGANTDRVHLFRVLESPGLLDDYQVLCVPGGFSYGDDIGAQHAAIGCIVELSAVMYGFNQFPFAKAQVD